MFFPERKMFVLCKMIKQKDLVTFLPMFFPYINYTVTIQLNRSFLGPFLMQIFDVV